jgi:hypothetical protein
MIILTDVPIKVGGTPVFTESWDFEYALRMTSGRRDISARVDRWRIRYEKDYVAETPDSSQWPLTDEIHYPYRNLYLYDYGKNALERLSGPPH